MANVQVMKCSPRVDIADVVGRAPPGGRESARIGFAAISWSATTPSRATDLAALRTTRRKVVQRLFPECEGALWPARGWRLFRNIDRVYVISLAMAELGWRPKYEFPRHVLECLRAETDFRSPLAREVGSKGYHARVFEHGLTRRVAS